MKIRIDAVIDRVGAHIRDTIGFEGQGKLMNKPTKILLGAVLFLILGIAGNMDYHDAVLEEQHYVTMVCDGFWPDYQELEPECDRSE